MAIGALISVEEYLHTSYRPDCDYVDGEILERNLGEIEHSDLQREILIFLTTRFPELRRRVQPEQRVQVKPNRFRIPDLCVLTEAAPREKIVITAPTLCIEILSPEDTMPRMLDRVKDYLEMGVPVIWIIDPIARRGWITTHAGMKEPADGILRADSFAMPLSEVLD